MRPRVIGVGVGLSTSDKLTRPESLAEASDWRGALSALSPKPANRNQPGCNASQTCRSDFVITDKDGSIVTDTRKDRIEKRRELAELAAQRGSKDETAASILASYRASVRDPNNELVHLYEIREALSSRFGGDKPAQMTLQISSTSWSEFGNLANNEPIRQGRHRGNHAGKLRDATEAELKTARNFTRSVVRAYLQYLDASSSV